MKQEVKGPVLIGVIVVALVAVAAWGIRSVGSAGNLDHGQIPYTPGIPPFLEKDPAKRGPGMHGPAAPPNIARPGTPEGPPSIGNGK